MLIRITNKLGEQMINREVYPERFFFECVTCKQESDHEKLGLALREYFTTDGYPMFDAIEIDCPHCDDGTEQQLVEHQQAQYESDFYDVSQFYF